MKRRDRTYIAVLVVLTALYIVVEYTTPKPIDWSPSFKPTDTRPYGTYLINQLLADAFPNAQVLTSDRPLYWLLNREDEQFADPQNLLIVNSILANQGMGVNFSIDAYDTDLLFDFVNAGGNVFLAAERFAGPLADSLNIETAAAIDYQPSRHGSGSESDSVSLVATDAPEDQARNVAFVNPALGGLSFALPERLATWYFDSVDTARTTVLANLDWEGGREANFVRASYGDGAFFVSTMPYAFTNFALADSNAAGWSFAALSHLPVATTIWNANYIPGRGQNSLTPIRYILSNPPLKWAWFIILAGSSLFILFRARRRQRIIPVVRPHTNATLDFVNTVGRLYFQRGNHDDLARKKIAHFQEYLRSRLKVDGRTLNSETTSRITSRSGVPPEVVDQVVSAIGRANQTRRMSAEDLLRLSKPIDEFYKRARR